MVAAEVKIMTSTRDYSNQEFKVAGEDRLGSLISQNHTDEATTKYLQRGPKDMSS